MLAIQGHPTRGKEVIKILESLGGKNNALFIGVSDFWYFIDSNGHIRNEYQNILIKAGFKTYTLEGFEKEFPFKIGDEVTTTGTNHPKIITGITDTQWGLRYVISEIKFPDSKEIPHISQISLYKEMKEERNVTLTLDKAKEWYKKGGELREVALQAYSEEELTKVKLPKTWEEFCENYRKRSGEAYISNVSSISEYSSENNRQINIDKNVCPSKKSAKAHLAMIQLEQLRDCWLNGWIPKWDISQKYCIYLSHNEVQVRMCTNVARFLTFPTREMAIEFLECFRDLIELARNLI